MEAQLVAIAGNQPRAYLGGLGRRSGGVGRPVGQRSFSGRGARSAFRGCGTRSAFHRRRSGPHCSLRAARAVSDAVAPRPALAACQERRMEAQLVAIAGNQPRACCRGLGRRSGRVGNPLGQRSFRRRGARSACRGLGARSAGDGRSGPRGSLRSTRAVGGAAERRRCPLGRRPLRRRSRFRRPRPPLISSQRQGSHAPQSPALPVSLQG